MNFDKSTRHEDTLGELAQSVRHYRRDPDVAYFLNKWAKERMEDIRRFYGVPKTALASMLGTTYRQYIRYEGDSSKVPVQVVSALALFYNLSLDFLCGLPNVKDYTLPVLEQIGYVFHGWYLDESCEGTPIAVIPAGSTSDYVLYASWERVSGLLTYELDGGEITEELPKLYEYGVGMAEMPATVSKYSFAFKGWYYLDADGNQQDVTSISADDRNDYTLYAKWEKVGGLISYELNDGVMAEGVTLPDLYSYGTALAIPTDITKYGSTFLGWYDNEACEGEKITEISADRRGDVTLYAKWQKDFGVIYLYLNGGALVNEGFDNVVKIGTTITPPEVTREGAELVGWYLDAECTQKVESITPETNADIHLYAKWKYAIESGSSHAQNIQYGDIIKENGGFVTFVFDADASGAGASRNGVIRVRNKNIKYEVYLLQFAGDNIKDAAGNVISDYKDGDKIEIVINFYSGDMRYYVNGVYVGTTNKEFDSDLSNYNYVQYVDHVEINYLWQYNAGGSTAFDVEVWTGDLYSDAKGFGNLTFDLDNGVVDGELPEFYLSSEGMTLPVPTKFGYIFLGWYTKADFSGDAVTEIAKGTNGDFSFYAKWEKSFSVVELHLDGGAVVGDFDPKIVAGQEIVLPTNLLKAGGIFMGWYSDEELTQKITSVTPESDAENIHVYAKWADTYWSKSAGSSTTEYYFGVANGGWKGGDIGSDMIAAGSNSLTLRFNIATSGNESWTTGSIRLRQGLEGAECHFVKFANGNMVTGGGAILTEENSGATVDFVINFADKTVTYYVNGEQVAEETYSSIGSDLTYYNYETSPTGDNLSRGNMFQLTNPGSVGRTLVYDGVSIFISDIYGG